MIPSVPKMSSCFFLNRADSVRANFIQICMYTHCASSESATCYDLHLPFDAFVDVLERAARHLSYSPRSMDLTSYHCKNGVVLECFSSNNKTNIFSETLRSSEAIPGAKIVCNYMHHCSPSANTFSCAREDLVDVRTTSRLALRVNNNTNLLFDSYRNSASKTVRTVYLQIRDVDKLSEERGDVARTVENTVQGVMMGMRLKQAPRLLRGVDEYKGEYPLVERE